MHRLLVLCLLWPGEVLAEWPQFRGPAGQGHASTSLPLEWSSSKNVVWKQDIPGAGWSSPVVSSGKIYLTTAVPIAESKDLSLRTLCLDARDGNILWNLEVFRQDSKAPRIHSKNSHASPTPVVEGNRIFVHFGHQGTACLDNTGQILWTNREFRYAPVHGNGGSPIIEEDLLLFSTDGSDVRQVVALDTATGKVRWQSKRTSPANRPFSFSTPLVILVAGQKQLISPGSDMVSALRLSDGKEIWRVRYKGYSVIPRPVFGQGLLFISTGYERPEVLAIRPDGQGDVTESHIAWRHSKGAPHTPSMLLVGEELYMVSDNGSASCLDARSGKLHWSRRVPGSGYSASPLYAEGKIYLQSEDGIGTVLRAGTSFEQLARNPLEERTLASYAVVDGDLLIRTADRLYRIGK